MNIHKIKEVEPNYSDVVAGKKTFVIVPAKDDFQIGDMLLICQFTDRGFTGIDVQKTVSYILSNCEGLAEGYVVVGLGEYEHKVDSRNVPTKVLREGNNFLERTMFGDCPHCGAHIIRKDSPETCKECGGPVIWSESKFSF